MSKINVLVLNDFTRDNRVLKISRTLHAAGHEVQVLALWRPGLPAEEQGEDGVRVIRLRLWSHRLPQGKFWGMIKWLELATQVVFRHSSADAWHCNDIEAFVLGVAAKLRRPQLKLVYDCHELESERNAQAPWMRKTIGWLEHRFIRRAAVTLVVSPSILGYYQRKYQASGLGPIYLVRNVPHAPWEHQVLPSVLGFQAHFGLPAGTRMVLYQGAFTFNRGLECCIAAAQLLDRENIHLVFMGYGPLQALVDQAVADHANVHYMPAVPYEQVLAWTRTADVGLVSVAPVCLSYLYCLPNKLFEYIQAGIPVLTNNLPDCASLVLDHGVGEVVLEDTPSGWATGIRLVLSKPQGNYQEALEAAASELCWQKESQILLQAYRTAGIVSTAT